MQRERIAGFADVMLEKEGRKRRRLQGLRGRVLPIIQNGLGKKSVAGRFPGIQSVKDGSQSVYIAGRKFIMLQAP